MCVFLMKISESSSKMECDNPEDIVLSSQNSNEVIRAIDRNTVHKICSGQVVLSLGIAVKELVENSIDAGATRIDVRLKEYGSELIEVSDNGKGVLKENFQALTLKHFTSKIRNFTDLETVGTLGFRGEALSSLCALSDLTILTKHQSDEFATKLIYDRNGKIISENVGAREHGTTVSLENLFSSLPVRRKEFVKNLKREFNKMCQLLYAYCLVSKGIKFNCTNINNKGSRNVVVATEGALSPRDNIINVFGPKQISSLIEVEVVEPNETILTEHSTKLGEGEPLPFTFDLFISSVMHGSGRSSSDRQFFYINSRPCDPPKISKLVNDTYRQFNSNQYPFVYLNVMSMGCLVDVNVTPDKRQLFLEKENILLATIKTSLLEAFKAFPSTYKLQNLELSQSQTSQITDFFDRAGLNKSKGMKRSATDGNITKGSILQRFQKRSRTESSRDFANESLNSSLDDSFNGSDGEKIDSFVEIACRLKKDKKSRVKIDRLQRFKSKTSYHLLKESQDEESDSEKEEIVSKRAEDVVESPQKSEIVDVEICKNDNDNVIDPDVVITLDSPVAVDDLKNRPMVTVAMTIEKIAEMSKQRDEEFLSNENGSIKVRFRTKIAPGSDKSAEEELQKQITKEDFGKMTIIGQFNLGFIIAKLNNDIFIIDQHASDEKYNFEKLQANTIIESQVLVNPKPLELTAGNESLLIEHEEIFKKNGFAFKIDNSAPCTQKVSLIAIPMSKNIVFGKDDIDEMLFMLKDSTTTNIRPTRVRAMFASRACRKSVMIGRALSRSDMKRLVDHMGEIEQPWGSTVKAPSPGINSITGKIIKLKEKPK